jgi:hypothetical protein
LMIIISTTVRSSCLLIVLEEHRFLPINDHRWLPKSCQPGGWIVEPQGGRWESLGGTQQDTHLNLDADKEMSDTVKCIRAHEVRAANWLSQSQFSFQWRILKK